MKAKPVMREICYTTNMIPAKDIKMNDDWKFPPEYVLGKVVSDSGRKFLYYLKYQHF
jgi:hypothetical protein